MKRQEQECVSISSGKMQDKVCKPGKVQLKNDTAYGQQRNRVWDPKGKGWRHMIRSS